MFENDPLNFCRAPLCCKACWEVLWPCLLSATVAHPEVPDHTITTQLHFLCGWKRGGLYKSFRTVLGSLLHNLCSMEPLGHLSALLASFLVLSWMVPFADSQITSPPAPRLSLFRPPHIFVHGEQVQLTRTIPEGQTAKSPLPPNLSLFPKHPIYIQGEGVALTCSAPAGLYPTGYMFYDERESQAHEVQPKNPSNTLRLDGKTAGRYSCVYWFRVSGREIQSPRSNSVSVVRTEPPKPPTLFLQPQHPIYIQGEEVTLICSAPKGKAAAGYAFYQQKPRFYVERLRSHNVCRLDGKAAGTFLCAYWIHVSGREIQSQSSISVSVARTDLPAPVLKVDPPSGAVNEGEPLLISCLANRSNTEKRFHFSRDGVEMDSSNEGPLRDPSSNATLKIPLANSSHSGEFACSYEENMSGRWVSSPLSQMVNVTVHAQDSSLSAAVYVRFALLLLIPVVSLTCYYYCWRRDFR